MSRILWLSNAPWAPSGYGEQSALFLPRLRALGHEVAVQTNWGVVGKIDSWQGFTVYPADGAWGNESIGTYMDHHRADFALSLCDAFVLRPPDWPGEWRMGLWTPIDTYPASPVVLPALSDPRIQPIAMSRFGEKQMRDCGLDPIYVPHGIDRTLFRPRPELRAEARAALEVPEDAFLVGMVAANKASGELHRKAFGQAFLGFARFAQRHLNAWLYCHTDALRSDGWNLDQLSTISGVPQGRLKFPNEKAWHLGISREILATLYQAFDVLLMPSMGEGFGIPLLEAQACGIPVIASNHSAMTELTQAGWLVEGDPFWQEAAKAFFICPFVDSITAALEAAHEARGDEQLRAAAVEFAAEYDVERVTLEHWVPALERLGVQESRQVRRARERREAKRRKVAA